MGAVDLTVTVAVAAVSGAGAAALTPWAQWAVETRRRRDDRRLQIIAEGRSLIGDWHREHPGNLSRDFMNDERFDLLRPHLSAATLKLLNDPTVHVVMGGRPNDAATAYTRAVLGDMEQLERDWKLI
jgi:hypothetical protein